MTMTPFRLIHHWLKENYEGYSTILLCEITGHHDCHIGNFDNQCENMRFHKPFIEISKGYTDERAWSTGIKLSNIYYVGTKKRFVVSFFSSEIMGREEVEHVVWNNDKKTIRLSINNPEFFDDLKDALDKGL